MTPSTPPGGPALPPPSGDNYPKDAATDRGLTFASSGPWGVHYAKCWPCQTGECPGGWHTWADHDYVEHAAKTQQGDPTKFRCGCPCADGVALDRSDDDRDFDLDAPGFDQPCPICDAPGACGYDSEGRALIHADLPEDEAPTP